MSIAILSHPDCLLHQGPPGHPEQPARVKVITEALHTYPFKCKLNEFLAPLATREQLLRAHDANYVDWITSIAPESGLIGIDEDTFMNAHTLNAALRAAGAMVYAVDLVMQAQTRVAFCNIRPPGHHAERDKAMGFCFFNNVAIGALHAFHTYGLKRIAIVDFDVHHGNGTQTIFQHDKRLMYCSSFEYPFYPGYDEELDTPHILSVPLAAGTTGDEFRTQVAAAWFDQLNAFQPELILFSAALMPMKKILLLIFVCKKQIMFGLRRK